MFCTSLRRRPSYASVIPSLISADQLKLRGEYFELLASRFADTPCKESKLDTHDLEVPLSASSHSATGSTTAPLQLRILLLSPSSTTKNSLPVTLDRIHRFAALTGGQNLAMVFLLSPPKASTFISVKHLTADDNAQATDMKGVVAYSTLQASLLPRTDIPHIPILPLASVDDLPQLLKDYINALPPKSERVASAASPFELLQLCTTEPPMDRQTAYFATDCFASLKDLATACTEPLAVPSSSSPASRADFGLGYLRSRDDMPMSSNAQSKLEQLRGLVGDEKLRELADFWVDEWVVD
ncbi:hypothetical protein Q7P37_001699 [Cladosporium fusiforme]